MFTELMRIMRKNMFLSRLSETMSQRLRLILFVTVIFYCWDATLYGGNNGNPYFYDDFHTLDSLKVHNQQIYDILNKFTELEKGTYYYPDLIIIIELGKIDEYHLPPQCDLLTSGNYSCYLMVSSIKKSIAWHPACSYGYFTYNGFDTIIVCSQNHSYGLFSKTGKKHKLHFYIPKPETLMSQDDSHTQICFYYNHSKDEFICDWGSIYIGSSKN